jgi:uncharacterized protein (DUF427 family)
MEFLAMTDRKMSTNSGPGYAKHPGYRIDIAPAGKRVQVFFNGQPVADSRNALLMREENHQPVTYFPRADVDMALLRRTDHATHCPFKGDASYWTLDAGGQTAQDAVWSYEAPCDEVLPIKGYLAFYRDRMEAWYEDDERVLGSAHGHEG